MASPIEHVVILFKENHTFDNYFGTFPGAEGVRMPHSPNPPTKDPDHSHAAWLKRGAGAVKQQFLEQDIPQYFAYARQFTICDHYFTDVAGPSTPNHLMVIAADSPVIDNPPSQNPPVFDLPSLPAALQKAGLSWGNYGATPSITSKRWRGRTSSHPINSRPTPRRENCLQFPGPMHRTMPMSTRQIRPIRETRWWAMSRTECSGRWSRLMR
jgi:phospholipase C